ncbi:unnamed protein product [Closterium sp. NIES-65]|nr:unnamed protein product [Closterium sp. NIES-65]
MSVGSSFKESWCGKAHLGCSDMRVVFQGSRSVASRSTRTAGKGLLVQASFMGVGAPEALVIGVVALLVFGPKGLAEMARGVGKTLKTFQPTIRELQEVSREFRDTLQSEIGIDDIRNPPPPPPTPVAAPPAVPPTLSAAAPAASPAAAPAATAASAAAPNVTIIPKEFSADDVAKVTEQQLAAAATLNTVTDDMKKGEGPRGCHAASRSMKTDEGRVMDCDAAFDCDKSWALVEWVLIMVGWPVQRCMIATFLSYTTRCI